MKNKVLELLSFRTIRGKFFNLTLTLTVIPILILSLAFYPIVANMLRNNAESEARTSLTIGNDFLDNRIIDLLDLTNVILSNEGIQSILTSGSFDGYTYLENNRETLNIMTSIIGSKSYIQSYFLYDLKGDPMMRIYNSGFPVGAGVTQNALTVYRNLHDYGPIIWLDQNPLNDYRNSETSAYLYVLKLLRSTSGENPDIGYVILEIDKSKFFEGLNFLKPNAYSQFYLYNQQGSVLFHLPEQEPLYFPKSPKTSQVFYNHTSYISMNVINHETRWTLVHLVDTTELYRNVVYIRNLALLVYVILVVTGWGMSYWLGNSIRHPLYRIQQYMKSSINQQKYPISFDTRDEVGLIGDQFVRMLQENKRLNKQVVDAEIKALQAQINPHFLYNILESLNWFAISRKQYEISEVIEALGKFFRITISRGKDRIPVSEEIDHVNSYVKVQRFRYHGKFSCIVEIDTAIKSLYIPKFLLQPLVENAIYHGLKPKQDEGTIFISGELKANTLIFSVTDDGVGMPPLRLHEIEQALYHSVPGNLYGLKNVHDRIRLRFGEPYGLQLVSKQGVYTTATITIPLLQNPSEGVTINEDLTS